MSVLAIRATIECDECGERFRVGIDPATRPFGSAWDLAEAAVRAGDFVGDGGPCSVQSDKMLCGDCTKVADEGRARPCTP